MPKITTHNLFYECMLLNGGKLSHILLVWCCIAGWFLISISPTHGLRKYSAGDMHLMRERIRHMFQHAYDGYLQYGAPYDELRPLSCDAIDTWGSYSLTLIDALDTLAVMGNYTEFGRVVQILRNRSFDADINVSVFETNIRIIGGLLSAHLLSQQADLQSLGLVEPGWPCEGPLLTMAEDVAQRLLPAFDTVTGMPYGTVNLRHGVPYGETSVTCTAGIGTFILEFGTLSRLTGNPIYEDVAMHALTALHHHRSPIGLYGNHIDVQTGRWIAQDAGIGAGVDSYFEYLVKGSILLEKPGLMATFLESKASIDRYLKRDDWYVWVSMSKGQLTLPVFQSLEAYWPGLLSLYGNTPEALRVLHSYQSVWRQYGFLPEFYNIPTGEAGTNRENYPLRPELIESVMYLYRATGDPFLLEVGENILESIEHSAKTACGYATIRNVLTHQQEDRMESFFLAETTKYLYLLFDPSNFLHNDGRFGSVIQTMMEDLGNIGNMRQCVVGAGGFIFNTEAHPIDPMALRCCEARHSNIFANMSNNSQAENPVWRGEILFPKGQGKTIPTHKKNDQTHQKTVNAKETVFLSSMENETEGKKEITTISAGTENEANGFNGIKTKTISSTITVSNGANDLKSAEKPPSEVIFESYTGTSDDETESDSILVKPLEPKAKTTDKQYNELLTKESVDKAFVSTDQQFSSSAISKHRTESDSREKAEDVDKTGTPLAKVVQNMFYNSVEHQNHVRSKFEKETFYQKLMRKRAMKEKVDSTTYPAYLINKNMHHDIMSCRAQSYFQRLSILEDPPPSKQLVQLIKLVIRGQKSFRASSLATLERN